MSRAIFYHFRSVPVVTINMYQFGMHSTHDQSTQQFSKNKLIFDWAWVPRGWAVNSDTHVDGSNLTEVTDSQVGEWKKLPGGEFLCHRIVEDAQEEA